MKKLLIIMFSALSLTAFAQGEKTVAVLDPICRDNSVNPFFQQMVRGAMESAITASAEYEAYDRSAFDQIQKEQAFQRTGAVSDSQIKEMGELAGVDYVLVSEVSAFEGYMSVIIKVLNVTTGKYDKSEDDYTQLSPDAVKTKCKEMASSLFGSKPTENSAKESNVPDGYVDLGLPSGTLWKAENEDCGFLDYERAFKFYGNSLPTHDQCKELLNNCLWTWQDNGYKVMGKNNEFIFFPAAGGNSGCDNSQRGEDIGRYGFYWSSTSCWALIFNSRQVWTNYIDRCSGCSIRLVK